MDVMEDLETPYLRVQDTILCPYGCFHSVSPGVYRFLNVYLTIQHGSTYSLRVELNKFSDLFSEEIIAQTTVTDFEK